MTDKKQDSTGLGFEKSLARLEDIVDAMEKGDLDLEKMISHFEEGQGLIKYCTKKLNEVEKKVEKLIKKGDNVKTEPFEENHDDSSDAGDNGELF